MGEVIGVQTDLTRLSLVPCMAGLVHQQDKLRQQENSGDEKSRTQETTSISPFGHLQKHGAKCYSRPGKSVKGIHDRPPTFLDGP